jgi:flagellin
MPVISTNTAANTALRYLNINSENQSSALSKLASGSRIVKASDDAAGLAIGTQLKSDVSVLDQASTNASQAVSILQTADGGLASISDILIRMKALATEAASGNVTDSQRENDINTEYLELYSEITAIQDATRYSGQSLLSSSGFFSSAVDFLVGTTSSDKITVSLSALLTSMVASTMLSAGSTVSTASAAASAIDALTTAIDTVTKARAQVGAYESRFSFRSQSVGTTSENTSAAQSAMLDADVASEKSKLSSADVLNQASIAALSQAAKMPQELLTLLQS